MATPALNHPSLFSIHPSIRQASVQRPASMPKKQGCHHQPEQLHHHRQLQSLDDVDCTHLQTLQQHHPPATSMAVTSVLGPSAPQPSPTQRIDQPGSSGGKPASPAFLGCVSCSLGPWDLGMHPILTYVSSASSPPPKAGLQAAHDRSKKPPPPSQSQGSGPSQQWG